MTRLALAVITCAALATVLAKPSPSAKSKDLPEPVPFDFEPEPLDFEPVPYESKAQPIDFQSGGTIYVLPTGNYYFTSPNYPRWYPNNFDSGFTLRGDSNQDITINCTVFRMESHSSCSYDFLSINGQKYCGSNTPPTTTVSELTIRLKTDHSVRKRGFYCLVTIAPGSGTTAAPTTSPPGTTAAPTTSPPGTTTAPPADGCRCGQRQMRVVGGSDANEGDFPWQAGLVQPGGTRTFCGGSVINSRYVLTAAHCTEGSSPGQIEVLLGDLHIGSPDEGQQRFSVRRIVQHPQYTSASVSGWDFALLELDQITFGDTIQPVCLAEAGVTYAGDTAIASGYGRVGADQPQATTLQFVSVPVWSQDDCARVWRLTSSMICAGGSDQGGRSVCNGDSGGPLVTEDSGTFRLIGVVSFGRPCAIAGVPDVYGRVSEALRWIQSETSNAQTCTP